MLILREKKLNSLFIFPVLNCNASIFLSFGIIQIIISLLQLGPNGCNDGIRNRIEIQSPPHVKIFESVCSTVVFGNLRESLYHEILLAADIQNVILQTFGINSSKQIGCLWSCPIQTISWTTPTKPSTPTSGTIGTCATKPTRRSIT